MYQPLDVIINGDKWKVYVLSKRNFVKKEGESTKAVVYPLERRIYFSDEDFHFFRVGHEIFHAFFNYLYLDDVKKMNVDDMEEVMANFLSERADDYVAVRDKIFKHFKKLIQKGKKLDAKKN